MSLQKPVQLILPLPPSVNSYYTNGKNWSGKRNRRRSDKAMSFLLLGVAAVRMQGSPQFHDSQVVVSILLHTREYQGRDMGGDLDNFNKGTLDLLTHAGVWTDDDQILDLRIIRRGCVPGGCAIVSIRRATKTEIGKMTIVETLVHKLKEWGLI